MLPILDKAFIQQVDGVKDLILAEVNVKDIEYVTDTSGIVKKSIKPNFKTLGRILGKNMKAAIPIINQLRDGGNRVAGQPHRWIVLLKLGARPAIDCRRKTYTA